MNRLKQELESPAVTEYIRKQDRTVIKQANMLIAALQGLIHNNHSTAQDFIKVYNRYNQEISQDLQFHDITDIITEAKQCIQNIKTEHNIG
jgi:hypothetical protein